MSRIAGEAATMGFEDVFAWDESRLEPEFMRQHGHFIRDNPRGYGYWLWKPHLISVVLKAIPEGACLLYADGGCSLNPEGKRRLKMYEFLAGKGNGMLAFSIRGNHPQFDWCKMDVIEKVGGDGSKPQCLGGVSVFINTQSVRAIVDEWSVIAEENGYHNLNNAPSIVPNHPSFREHRHDQSIFSLLAYKYGATIIPDETYWPEKWDATKMFPVHSRRLKF